MLAFRETSTKEKREMSKNLDLLTNENFHLRKELEILIEQNKGSTNQVEEYTEKITGLEVTNHKNLIFLRFITLEMLFSKCSK